MVFTDKSAMRSFSLRNSQRQDFSKLFVSRCTKTKLYLNLTNTGVDDNYLKYCIFPQKDISIQGMA